MSNFSISDAAPGFPAPKRNDLLFEGLVELDAQTLSTFGAEGGYGEFAPACRFVNVSGVGGSVNANGNFFLTVRGT